jgi:hypothetical protein
MLIQRLCLLPPSHHLPVLTGMMFLKLARLPREMRMKLDTRSVKNLAKLAGLTRIRHNMDTRNESDIVSRQAGRVTSNPSILGHERIERPSFPGNSITSDYIFSESENKLETLYIAHIFG